MEISLLVLQAAKQVSKLVLKLSLGTQVQSSKDIWQLYSKINQVHSATMQEEGQVLSQIIFSLFPCGIWQNFHLGGIIKKVKCSLTYFVDPDGATPGIPKYTCYKIDTSRRYRVRSESQHICHSRLSYSHCCPKSQHSVSFWLDSCVTDTPLLVGLESGTEEDHERIQQ